MSRVFIEPPGRIRSLGLGELWAYRSMLRHLVWRDVRVRYAQTVLGAAWALLQPAVNTVLFTLVFGRWAKLPSDGLPYPLFALAALVPWTYFSTAIGSASGSLLANSRLVSKVYFARLVIPLSSVAAALVDFSIALLALVVALFVFGATPSPLAPIVVPALALLMVMSAAGLGMFISALSILYRDFRHLVPFAIQGLFFASPVVYPSSLVPEAFRTFYALNPMVTVIEGMRAVLLGGTPPTVGMIATSVGTSLVVLVVGAWYFKMMEHHFADVI